ncbi:unnamed protein product [Trichobilharzia szidati]|nr:unnamed protein product [Trichobilharzia szidati]
MLLRIIGNPFYSLRLIANRKYTSSAKIPEYLLDRTVKPEEVLDRLTPYDAERLEFCMTEYRTMLEQGASVPKSLSKKNILDLLCCTSFTSRANFLKFLFKCEKREENALRKKAEKGSSVESLYSLPWSITPDHFSKAFPIHSQEQPVILLSPNARRTFEAGEYDHTAAYVIGAVVDKAIRRPISSAIARQLGIKCVSLPLDRYLKWGSGKSKTLSINCIHGIMATAKETNGDWRTALIENIPTRFYSSPSKTKSSLIYRNL